MEDSQIPIVFDEDGDAFEGLAKENGKRTWSARKLMAALGYDKWPAFKKVIEKAISACALLGIPVFEHFAPAIPEVDGRNPEDFTLSRFGCCMTALNADSSNRNVAAAQVYFVSLAEIFAGTRMQHAESMDRLAIREEISEREIVLSETAAASGVNSYSAFRVAGYVAMYDMDYQSLRKLRGVSELPRRSILDFMGKDELAGNLFRLSLTEGRIKKEGTRGQVALETVARQVGRRVRQTMHEEIGLYPEQMPTAQDIKQVRKGLKRAGVDFEPLDDLKQHRIDEQRALSESLPDPTVDAVPGCSECSGGAKASHYGSAKCTSGSLASGGSVAHCTCDHCY
jgi:DNA-damage-inducible protein D